MSEKEITRILEENFEKYSEDDLYATADAFYDAVLNARKEILISVIKHCPIIDKEFMQFVENE